MNDAKYWLDKIKTEKPKWFKITKKMKSLFINGETIDLDGLTIKKAKRSEINHPTDIALREYVNYENSGFYELDKSEFINGEFYYKHINLSGKEIEALYKLHKANKNLTKGEA
tara:strand:- start:163 stop:501 length:339 start_codon:yes stop_codon:yes gene_type:complete